MSAAFAHFGNMRELPLQDPTPGPRCARAQHFPNMDPAETELAAITNLFTLPRSLVDWRALLWGPVGFETHSSTGMGECNHRLRVCLLLMRQTPGSPGRGGPPKVPAPCSGAAAAPAMSGARVVGECRRSSTSPSMLKSRPLPRPKSPVYKDCKDYGDFASTEADPSAAQLASLKQVVASGSAPYADFSFFCLLLLRKQTFTSYQLNVATVEWSKREQPGPASCNWKVLRTSVLLRGWTPGPMPNTAGAL